MEHSRLPRLLRPAGVAVIAAALSACAGAGTPPQSPALQPQLTQRQATGLGPVVQSKFGGEIYGWDINQNGNDGLLTETLTEQNGMNLNAIETFDQTTGKIIKVVRKTVGLRQGEPVVDAIAGNDVGIVDVERLIAGKFVRHDKYQIVNPVSGNKITRQTHVPHPIGFVTSFVTNNQASANQIVMGFFPDMRGDDIPGMYAYDTATNTWSHRLTFPRRQLFDIGFPLYAAVDAQTNEAVTGFLKKERYNPHESPSFDVVNAATGAHLRNFYGLGEGFPNGMAIDSTTGVMCTTTTHDMDVEFYKLATGKGKAVQIPVLHGGGAETNGAAVAVDPIHHLFLVAQLNSTFSPSGGSTVIVYDEKGKLIEYIDGFEFLDNSSVVVAHLAVNPANRTGYVNGPSANELQEFSY